MRERTSRAPQSSNLKGFARTRDPIVKEKVSLKLGGGLSQCYIHAPIMISQEKLLFNKIYARLSLNNLSMLDTSCSGYFMMKTIEFRWDLLERI